MRTNYLSLDSPSSLDLSLVFKHCILLCMIIPNWVDHARGWLFNGLRGSKDGFKTYLGIVKSHGILSYMQEQLPLFALLYLNLDIFHLTLAGMVLHKLDSLFK